MVKIRQRQTSWLIVIQAGLLICNTAIPIILIQMENNEYLQIQCKNCLLTRSTLLMSYL